MRNHSRRIHLPTRIILAFAVYSITIIPSTVLATTIEVEAVPDDVVSSGNALIAAFSEISNPSGTNRYVIKVGPGIFEIGTTSLQMQPWVDLEGSGFHRTVIRGTGSDNRDRGTINASQMSEIRDLQVISQNGVYNIAIFHMMDDCDKSRIINVRTASRSGQICYGVRYEIASGYPTVESCEIVCSCSGVNIGIAVKSGVHPILRDDSIQSFGAPDEYGNIGLWFEGGSAPNILNGLNIVAGDESHGGQGIRTDNFPYSTPFFKIDNSHITSWNGIGISITTPVHLRIQHSTLLSNRIGVQMNDDYKTESTIEINHSTIHGSENTLNLVNFAQARVGATQLSGGPVAAAGLSPVVCANVYDEAYSAFTSSCP